MNKESANILIVDDIPSNIKLIISILDEHGYSVSYAQSGSSALEQCSKAQYDLILLDIMMPAMDGFQVCDELRKKDNYAHIPIIFLTARTDQESILKGFEMGAVDYVTKPFSEKELLVRIETHLDLKNTREALEKELIFKQKVMTENALYIRQRTELGNSVIEDLKAINRLTRNEFSDKILNAISKLRSLIKGQEQKEFELRFEEEYKLFRQKITGIHPNLTPNEIKLCTFLRLNMASKEISEITGQSVRALETARSRMRKKLGLSRSDNLVQYLHEIT